jgi:hypothetical protein
VVVVERELENVVKWEALRVPVVLCDFLDFPFRKRVAELVVFSFTLHEINPGLHASALRLTAEIAPRVLVVEPSPKGCGAYEEFAKIWRGAMRAVGRFEEYWPAEYWEALLEGAGFEILCRRTVKWNVDVPGEVLRELVSGTVEEWRKLGVPDPWIDALSELPEKYGGMRWSDIVVIEGRTL